MRAAIFFCTDFGHFQIIGREHCTSTLFTSIPPAIALLVVGRERRTTARSLRGRYLQRAWTAAILGLVVLAIAGWFAVPSRAQSTREAVGKAVERVYGARDYQTEMPQEQPVQIFQPLVIPDIVKEIIRIVLITLLVVGGLLLLFFLLNALPELKERFKRRALNPDRIGATALASDADRERLEIALSEADRLARQGAYGEALHLLLLYCLNEMRRRLGLSLPPSLTSREILGLSVLPEIRRRGLSVIISAVEISHFGGRPTDETIYQLCRQRCEDVVLGEAAA